MIAKIVASGEDRAAARARLGRALADTAVLGVATNLGFLARIVADPEFAAGAVDTGFIERRRDGLLPPPAPAPDTALGAAALHLLLSRRERRAASADPWSRANGWRLNTPPAPQRLCLRVGGEEIAVEAVAAGSGWRLCLRGRECAADAEHLADGRLALTLDGARATAIVLEHEAALRVFISGESWEIAELDPLAPPEGADTGPGRLTAPMPGRVVALLVAPGAAVTKGQPMMVIEAMKMEHTIAAPRDGVVAAVNFTAGDAVEEGAELIALEEIDAAAG
jgi:3-methylcrotonyl-CoA carboxylase alpha subunit